MSEQRRPETIYDLLRAMVERTGWRTEAEAREYRELLNRLEDLNVFGDVSARITTKTQVKEATIEQREDVRQLRGDFLGERPRLAAGDD